jgi:hypothetical protein
MSEKGSFIGKGYLGDSVYAEHDGLGTIILTTENGLPDDPSNTIYLSYEVWQALQLFASQAGWNS